MSRKRETFHFSKRTDRDRARSKSSEEWICGLNPVLEAVRAGRRVHKVFLAFSRRDRADIEQELAGRSIAVQKVDLQFFDERFHKGHQGIAATVEPREYADFDDLIEIPRTKKEVPLFLILDGIEDPRNFGSILRVADAGGVHGVVIQSHRSASLTPEAVKASAGASEHVMISMVPNIKHAINSMKESGITIVGAEAEGENSAWDMDFTGPVALVVGSEAEGMRRTVMERCDHIVRLPMQGKVNSLNASVATGVIVFEIMRQRMKRNEICKEKKA
ncbi:MAG: 23S rRNA (guanosine(2251)-2'-O)-methyltransferase RlmB [Nitrospirae bacterium]|nr:23S rRNA (guanosine(2251)-2'-O)-methyltransferase RlmB [Nitrospirota bacterium]